ncbi:hypothetical protein RUND412_007529 [Rhizina undulata]
MPLTIGAIITKDLAMTWTLPKDMDIIRTLEEYNAKKHFAKVTKILDSQDDEKTKVLELRKLDLRFALVSNLIKLTKE